MNRWVVSTRVLAGFGWVLVLLFQIIEVILTFILSALHFFILLPQGAGSGSAFRLSKWLVVLSSSTFLLFSLLHIASLFQTAKLMSLCLWKWATAKNNKSIKPKMSSRNIRPTQSMTAVVPTSSNPRPNHSVCSWILYILTRPWYLWQSLFAVDGLFGVNGHYFEVGFKLRELFEVTLQTFQLYTLSRAVSIRWINQMAVGMVATNCLLTPFVYFTCYSPHSRHRFRLINLVADLCLDIGCSIVIPLLTLYPIVLAFDYTKGAAPDALAYDDVWQLDALSVGGQLYITSILDYMSTMMPHMSFLHALSSLRYLVKECQTPKTSTMRRRNETRSRHGTRSARLFYLALVIWGCFLITVDNLTQTSSTTIVPGCRRYRPAWFSTQAPCALLHVNCYLQNISGTAEELSSVLLLIDTTVLVGLIVTHCPALTMPDALTQFHHLTTINLYNCTLVSWPESAAITDINHPMMVYMELMYTNLSTIPPGLAHQLVPQGLGYFGVRHSNLTVFPSSVEAQWSTHAFEWFTIEHTQITQFPIMKAKKLFFSSNQIKHIDDSLFANKQFESLSLSGNPITKLPSSLGDLRVLKELYVEHTMVSSIEREVIDWMGTVKNTTSFYGSPVCESQFTTACLLDHNTSIQSVPMDIIDAQRTLDFEKDLYQLREKT